MKQKQKVDLIINLLLCVIGIAIILLAIYGYSNFKKVFVSVMLIYAILNLIQFMLTKESKDYEGLYTVLGCLAISFLATKLDLDNTVYFSITVMSWVAIQSIIKFIKTDYYNDRRDKMYKLRIVTLILFIVCGILTSMSFNFLNGVRVLTLGYFFFVNGILELFDPVVKYLLTR